MQLIIWACAGLCLHISDATHIVAELASNKYVLRMVLFIMITLYGEQRLNTSAGTFSSKAENRECL